MDNQTDLLTESLVTAAPENESVAVPYIEREPIPGGFFSDIEDTSASVKVAIRVRPMSQKEQREGKGNTCISTQQELNKLQIGSKEFFFDQVFDQESEQQDLFDCCAYNLVLGTFAGYNATILAYGQTGSGKTHTMGTGSTQGVAFDQIGIVPRVFDLIFDELDNRRRQSEFSQFELKVQFLELYGEEMHDLLDTTSVDTKTGNKTKTLSIREEKNGAISIQNLKAEIVTSKHECHSLLNKGISQRVTSATNMNEGSSRSHAIFTITITQKIIKVQMPEGSPDQEPITSEENISAKFHFVDLAGSERMKKTGATGRQMQEGININKGLLALGNVISALTDDKKQANGQSFIPYRDSKLTRILQDSLGGNSRTTMIACASPADSNMDESLSTVKYASRARGIKNKPVINRDANSILIDGLRNQLAKCRSENSQLQKLLTSQGIPIPEFKEEPTKKQPPQPQIQPSTAATSQELRELKIKLNKAQQQLQECQATLEQSQAKLQTKVKQVDDLTRDKDDLLLYKEQLQACLRTNNLEVPQATTDLKESKKSIVDDYKQQLLKLKRDLALKSQELSQQSSKIQELNQKIQRDEQVMRKQLQEGKQRVKQVDRVLPDIKEIKTKFMEHVTNQLDTVFDEGNNSTPTKQSQQADAKLQQRVKQLESENRQLKKEKDDFKFNEDRFYKFKEQPLASPAKDKVLADKTVQKLKLDLKKTEQQVQSKIQELQRIQKRAQEDKLRQQKEEGEGIDVDSIKDWIKLNTEALLNQQELQNFLVEQRKQRDDIEDEMLQEGDRLTELLIQRDRLEEELTECDDGRKLEVEQELEYLELEQSSITQTLDTLEEHLSYVQQKVTKIEDQIQEFDPESIKPPRFQGLNSVEMAKTTLKTFFMVLLDLNVYKRDLETKCIEQDENILELQGSVNLLQERLGMSTAQKKQMVQRQQVIRQMVSKIQTSEIDNRSVQDLNLTKDEQSQLTKMSLGKIVENLRNKLQDEETKSQRLNFRIDSVSKELSELKLKIKNEKATQKRALTDQKIVQKVMSRTLSSGNLNQRDGEDFSLNEDFDFNQKRGQSGEKPEKRLSFKQRRDKAEKAKEESPKKPKRTKPEKPVKPTTKTPEKPKTTDARAIRQIEAIKPKKQVEKTPVQERQPTKLEQQIHESDIIAEANSSQEEDDSIQLRRKIPKILPVDPEEEEKIDTYLESQTNLSSQTPSVVNDTESEFGGTEYGGAKWAMSKLIRHNLPFAGEKMVDFDSHQDKLFVVLETSVLEISIRQAKVTQTVDLLKVIGDDCIIKAFCLLKDSSRLVVATQWWIYIFDYEMTLCSKVEVAKVSWMAEVDGHLTLVQQTNQGVCFSCRLVTGEEVASVEVQGKVKARAAYASLIFTSGSKIGRVAVPEMQIQFLEDSGNEIIDFDVSETCIFTTSTDSSLRVFDAESGVMLIAPMEEMECDHLARCDDYIVARCGQGQAMLVLRYQDGEDELEEVDFIDLQSGLNEDPGATQQRAFVMKGGHKVPTLTSEEDGGSEVGVILVGDLTMHQEQAQLSIRILKNRFYITQDI